MIGDSEPEGDVERLFASVDSLVRKWNVIAVIIWMQIAFFVLSCVLQTGAHAASALLLATQPLFVMVHFCLTLLLEKRSQVIGEMRDLRLLLRWLIVSVEGLVALPLFGVLIFVLRTLTR